MGSMKFGAVLDAVRLISRAHALRLAEDTGHSEKEAFGEVLRLKVFGEKIDWVIFLTR
jgi:hypothetical protein